MRTAGETADFHEYGGAQPAIPHRIDERQHLVQSAWRN